MNNEYDQWPEHFKKRMAEIDESKAQARMHNVVTPESESEAQSTLARSIMVDLTLAALTHLSKYALKAIFKKS